METYVYEGDHVLLQLMRGCYGDVTGGISRYPKSILAIGNGMN